MKAFFNTIINLGVDNKLTALDRRRIKTINLLNVIVAFFLLVGMYNYFIMGPGYPIYAHLFFLSLNILSLYFAKIRRSTWSFLIFTFNVNLSIFFINQFYPPDSGTYLYYYTLIISVVLLNNPNSIDKFAILHFVICVLFFIANLVLRLPIKNIVVFTPEKIKVIWYSNLIISSIVTAFLSVLLTRLIHNQNREIVLQNRDLLRTREAVSSSLKEKEVLLAELHHRVKNNLAIITGLLSLQEEACHSEEARQVLADSKARIMSMALVHKMLYENADLKSINAGRYSIELVAELFNSYNLLKKVRIKQDCDNIILPVSKSIPLGLILNEVVTNSIKYVFKARPEDDGEFLISIKQIGDRVNLMVKDNGPGFPEDFNATVASPSLGIYLIKTLAEQIDGEVLFSNDRGAKISLGFNSN